MSDKEFEKPPSGWVRYLPTILSAIIVGVGVAWAAPNLLGSVFISDPTTPANQLQINGSGQASVVCSNCSGSGVSTSNNTAYDGTSNATVSATSGAEAITAAPSLTTGRNYSLFMDLSGGLRVNCQTGCAGGTFNNNADNVATSATNGQAAAWSYLWDSSGGNWDRAPGTSTTGAMVSGSGAAGTAATGVVTVQGIASMTPVQVSQATAASLNATVVGTGTFAAQVTNATAANLKTETVGTVTPADAAALGTTSLRTYSAGGLYNGTTIDLVREAVNSLNSNGIGIATAQAVGQCDDTSPTAITENQFGNVRFGCADHALVVAGLKSGVATGLLLDANSYLNVNCATGCAGGAVTPTDARALGTTSLVTYSLGAFYNGSTTDMAREAVNAADTVGTGIGAAAIMGQCDDTTPVTVTENRFGNLRMNCTDHSLVVSGGLVQGAPTSGTLGSGIMGSVTTVAPTYTTAQMNYLSLDTTGALRVNVTAGGSGSGTSSTYGAAFPATGTAAGMSDGTNMVALKTTNGTALDVNCTVGCSGGTFNNNADNVATSATNGQAAAWSYLWDSSGGNWDRAPGTSTTGAMVSGSGAAGTAATGVVTVQGIASMTPVQVSQATAASLNATVVGTGTFAAQVTNATAANLKTEAVGNVTPADDAALGTTSQRTFSLLGIYDGSTVDMLREVTNGLNSTGAGIPTAGLVGQCDDTSPQAITENSFGNGRIDCATHAILVTPVPNATSGGLTAYTVQPAASDNHANIKNGAGIVYHIVAFNNSATINYYRLYNAASGFNGCNSATNLIYSGHIPANTSDAGFVDDIPSGIAFTTGISICVTGAYGQTSTTNATASAIDLNVLYK